MAGGSVGDFSDIVHALGGPGLVPARTFGQLREALRAGLPYASLSAVASGFGIESPAIASILGIPARTLARRKKERRLSPEESDRLFRLGRLAALAEEVLGTRAKASAWLHAGNRALGGATPLSQLDTDLGAEEVESALLRIAHGVVG
jgi:putative toxin-antitoxin system antitoxin component (TIGR02293 family)